MLHAKTLSLRKNLQLSGVDVPIRKLLEVGINPLDTDYKGRNVFHYLAPRKSQKANLDLFE